MTAPVVLEIPAQRDHLALVRLVVETAAHLADLPPVRVDDLRLAVSEGCTNAIDAHVEAGAPGPVRVEVHVSPEAVTVVVIDRAGGFDPGAAPAAPAPSDPHRLRHERGLGIPIMRSLVDEVRFEPTPEGTALSLVANR